MNDASRRRLGRSLLPVLFCLASVVEGNAQPSGTQGWMLGVESGATAVSLGGNPGDGAALVGARIGRRLNRIVIPYLGTAYADIESRGLETFDRLTFAHVDVGVRVQLADGRRRWEPYGDLALTWWPVTDVLRDGEPTNMDFTSGPTLSLGGGFAVYLSETWALDVNVKAGKGRFTDVPGPAGGTDRHAGAPRDLDATSIRLGVGFSWWP